MASTDARLQQLFVACDTKGSGFIGHQEMRELCANLGISASDADSLFIELDRDGDGKIDFDDFATGFRDCLAQPFSAVPGEVFETYTGPQDGDISAIATANASHALRRQDSSSLLNITQRKPSMCEWKDFLDGINAKTNRVFSVNKIQELQSSVKFTPTSLQLVTCFQDVVRSLMQDVQRLQRDNERMEHTYVKERENHEVHLRNIEEELDAQVQKIEMKIRENVREEVEAERKTLKEQMDVEMAELQSHLQTFQTVDDLLRKERGEDERLRQMLSKLEETSHENRQLRISLADTQTNISILKSEMTQLKTLYENRCREMNSEKGVILDYLQEQDSLMSQLNLLHEANKRLQDMNDDLRDTMETSVASPINHPSMSYHLNNPFLPKTGSVIGDYLQDEPSNATEATNNRKRPKPPSCSPSPTDMDQLFRSHEDSKIRTLTPSTCPQDNLEYSVADLAPLTIEDTCIRMHADSGLSTLPDMDSEGVISDPFLNTLNTTYEHVPVPLTTDYVCNFDSAQESCDTKTEQWLKDVEKAKKDGTVFEDVNLWSVPSSPALVSTDSSQIDNIKLPCNNNVQKKSPTNNCWNDSPWNEKIAKSVMDPTGPPDRMYKVVFAGDAAVGKSSFILRISKGVFVPSVSSTLGVDFYVRTLNVDNINITLQLWDTAGQERFRSITKSYFRRADGVMLLYDCTSERSFINVREWMQAIDEGLDKKQIPVMLCGNKADLRGDMLKTGRSVVTRENGEKLAREYGAIFLETSAKSGQNILDSVVQLTREMLSNEDIEVRTSGLRVDAKDTSKKGSCCK